MGWVIDCRRIEHKFPRSVFIALSERGIHSPEVGALSRLKADF